MCLLLLFRCMTLIIRVQGGGLKNLLPCTVKTFRQSSCNQRAGCLSCSKARIYDVWDGSLDKRKVPGLVPCCGQDGYQDQVPQQPIDTYHTYMCKCIRNFYFQPNLKTTPYLVNIVYFLS